MYRMSIKEAVLQQGFLRSKEIQGILSIDIFCHWSKKTVDLPQLLKGNISDQQKNSRKEIWNKK